MGKILDLMGMDPIQRQWLQCSVWSVMSASGTRCSYRRRSTLLLLGESSPRNSIYIYFCGSESWERSIANHVGTGDMTVSKIWGQVYRLVSFYWQHVPHGEQKARMPERGLRLQFRRFLVSQRLYTLSEVVNSVRALERVRIHRRIARRHLGLQHQ